MRRQMEDLQREAERQQRANRPGGWQQSDAPHTKKYNKNDGEYVPFQELDIQVHQETTSVDIDDSTITVENQITDAEWEEIK